MIGAALVAYSIAATALSVALVLAAAVLGRRRAALRHRVLTVGLGMLAVVPLLAPWIPPAIHWTLPGALTLEGSLLYGSERRAGPGTEPELARESREGRGAGARATRGRSPALPRDVASPSSGADAPSGPRRAEPLLGGLLALAGAGVALVGGRQVAAGVRLRRLMRRGASPPELRSEVETLRRELGVGRPVEAVLSAELTVPITWGLLRPAIALPSSAEKWPARRRRVAVLHELAHVRRGDAFAAAVSRLARALYWWNPVVWWLGRVARGDAEVASDALVVGSGVNAASYARQLLAILRSASGRPAPAGVAALGGEAGLAERIRELHRSRQAGLVARRAAWVTLLVAAAVTGGLGALQPSPETARPPAGRSPAATAESPVPLPGGEAVAPAAASPGAARGRGSTILGALVDALGDRDASVRRSAANALRGADEEPAREALARRLDDPDPYVRRAVEVALGLREHVGVGVGFRPTRWSQPAPRPGEVDALTAALAAGTEDERVAAADRLGNLQPAEAVPELVAALADPSAHVRMRAASALANIGDPRAAPAVIPLLRDPDEHVRQRAAYALGNLGDQVAVAPLGTLATDPDEHVRQAAASALGQLGDRRGTPALLGLLADPDEHVRRTAAGALGDLGDPRARTALVAASRDPDPNVRRSAVESLGELRAAGDGG